MDITLKKCMARRIAYESMNGLTGMNRMNEYDRVYAYQMGREPDKVRESYNRICHVPSKAEMSLHCQF